MLMRDTLGKLKYRPISFVSSTNTPIHLCPLNKIGLCDYCLFQFCLSIAENKIKLNQLLEKATYCLPSFEMTELSHI